MGGSFDDPSAVNDGRDPFGRPDARNWGFFLGCPPHIALSHLGCNPFFPRHDLLANAAVAAHEEHVLLAHTVDELLAHHTPDSVEPGITRGRCAHIADGKFAFPRGIEQILVTRDRILLFDLARVVHHDHVVSHNAGPMAGILEVIGEGFELG